MSIDKIRSALEAAAEYPNSVYAALKAENALAALAELEAELVELRARLAAINAPPTVEVTDDLARDIHREYADNKGDGSKVCSGRAMIDAVQSILGPTLGLVTREEMVREVEAAYREAVDTLNPCFATADALWEGSAARKRLEGGR